MGYLEAFERSLETHQSSRKATSGHEWLPANVFRLWDPRQARTNLGFSSNESCSVFSRDEVNLDLMGNKSPKSLA